jgi:hypothetical protein
MYYVLIKLILVASMLELGLSFKNLGECSSRACWDQLKKASHKAIRIEWRPISVFPSEAKKFHNTLR